MIVASWDDLITGFPSGSVIHKTNGELASPCPFCKEGGAKFSGEDRLVWFYPPSVLFCRACGTHSYEELAASLFGSDAVVMPSLIGVSDDAPVKRELYLCNNEYVRSLHEAVDREFWQSFGWTDETINRFQLGYGKLYAYANRAIRHIIPFKPWTVEGEVANGWALEGRLPYNSTAQEERNIKTAGLGREYFWAIFEDKNDETLIITEGLKDAISAYQIGFRSIVAILGSATDRESLSQWIDLQKFKRIIVASDNDAAGERYASSFRSYLKTPVYSIRWPADHRPGYDLTDLLFQRGLDSYGFVIDHLALVDLVVEKGLVKDVRVYYPDYRPETFEPTDLTTIRSELNCTIDDFLTNYKHYRRYSKRGVVKVLAAPPGAGKSYALVRAAEKQAREKIEERNRLRIQLEAEKEAALEQEGLTDEDRQAIIEVFEKRIENLRLTSVLYAGPFISGWADIAEHWTNPELWYNYEARNELNCRNLTTVSALAAKGYTPMAFCQAACPLKAWCQQHGYLSQDDERRRHPITYVRHQNLVQDSLLGEYDAVIIDENPLASLEAPVSITAHDLHPTFQLWDQYIEPETTQRVVDFMAAARRVFGQNAGSKTTRSGRSFMEQLDQELGCELEKFLTEIDPDVLEEYHPPTVIQTDVDYKALPTRSLPLLHAALLRELPKYRSDQRNYNSALHLVGGRLEIYPMQAPKLPANKPLIIADGTAMPELYSLFFNRDLSVYAPKIINPKSETIVYFGSDFTRTHISNEVGVAITDFNNWLKDHNHSVEDLFGQDFDLDKLPVDESMYDSAILKRILTLLKQTAEKHQSVLFVTYKHLRTLIEYRMKELYPKLHAKIQYGHYWSLRGTNRYKDVEAVLLVGCPRVGYDSLYRRISAWASLDSSRPYIFPHVVKAIKPYSGRYEGHSYYTYSDPFADSIVEMVEAGEVRQVLERIRVHTSATPKTAYLALSRPSAIAVTQLLGVGTTVNKAENIRHQDLLNFMTSYYKTNSRWPKYTLLTEMFNVSSKTIAAMRKGAEDLVRE